MDTESPAYYICHSCRPTTTPVSVCVAFFVVNPKFVHWIFLIQVDNALGCYDFLAVRDLDIGEMITVDYDACELESIAIPRCLCGEDWSVIQLYLPSTLSLTLQPLMHIISCRGSAKGFKDRMDEVMDDFAPHLPAYLLSYYEERKQNRNSQW